MAYPLIAGHSLPRGLAGCGDAKVFQWIVGHGMSVGRDERGGRQREGNCWSSPTRRARPTLPYSLEDMPDLRSIIHSDPDIHSGDPVFIGTRVPVRTLLDYIEGGDSLEVFLENFPSVTREQAVTFLEEAGRAALAQIA